MVNAVPDASDKQQGIFFGIIQLDNTSLKDGL